MRYTSKVAAVFLLGTLLSAASVAAAQPPKPGGGAAGSPATPASPTRPDAEAVRILGGDDNAQETRNKLRHLLTTQYPDTLNEVLRRDPSLLRVDAYLAPYPALAAFLQQHPEVALNPRYFLGSPFEDTRDPQVQRISAVRSMFESLTVTVGFMSFFALLGWVSKAVVDQLRWSKATKALNQAHAKVIDRLTSNEDLLAYIQTAAGQRYLMSTPQVGDVSSPVGAPYGRILSSVQIGSVASLVGIGTLFVSSRWAASPGDWAGDFSQMLFLVGVIVLAAGVGFVLSGLASYALSRRFGLIQTAPSSHA
jgi:hypothetical protein